MVDLFKLQADREHLHGLSDRDFDSLFTVDKPIIFNFHGYPWLIHRLANTRTNHRNLHVRGYQERGNINTPLELAINNEIDRFTLAIDVIDRVPSCKQWARTRKRSSGMSRWRVSDMHTNLGLTVPTSSSGGGRLNKERDHDRGEPGWVSGLYAFETLVYFDRGEIIQGLSAGVLVGFVVGSIAFGLAAARFISQPEWQRE